MLEFLRSNLAWMLVALGMSTVLWGTVAQQDPDVANMVPGVPVELRNKPAEVVVTSPVAPVNVDVRAPRGVVLFPGAFRASIDLKDASPGVQEFPVSVTATDRRVRVDGVSPDKITVRLEAIEKKEVPVRPNPVDNPPFGFVAKNAQVSPDRVTVSGPKALVDSVTTVVVDVRLDNARSSISQPIKPVAQNSAGEVVNDVTTSPESVLVEVPIEQQLSYKALPVAPQVAGSVGLGYQIVGIMVDPTIITVVGDPSVLDEAPFLSTRPIDVSGATADVVANTEVVLPTGVSLVRRQPITVRIYVSPVEASKVVSVAVQVKGVGDRQRAELTPDSVDVTVSGPMPLLSTLRPQDVQVVADVTGIAGGTQPTTVTATVPSPLRVDDLSPKQVTVVVRPQ